MISLTVGRQPHREQLRQVVGADGQQRHQQDAGGERADVQAEGEEPLEHRMTELVLAVRDGDGLDERRHRRRTGPQADDQADRDHVGLVVVQDGVDGVADQVVGDLLVEDGVQEDIDLLADVAGGVRSEQPGDVAGQAEQRQQQRRGGQRAPEGGLRAHPEQRVVPGLAQRADRDLAPALADRAIGRRHRPGSVPMPRFGVDQPGRPSWIDPRVDPPGLGDDAAVGGRPASVDSEAASALGTATPGAPARVKDGPHRTAPARPRASRYLWGHPPLSALWCQRHVKTDSLTYPRPILIAPRFRHFG